MARTEDLPSRAVATARATSSAPAHASLRSDAGASSHGLARNRRTAPAAAHPAAHGPTTRARAPGTEIPAFTAAPASGRELPEEVPIALVYDGETFAVMLATPADVEDFAAGFTLTEGLSARAGDVEVVRHANGIECRLALDTAGRRAFERRRRMTTGGSSCGLCGVRGLAQAVPPPPTVGGRETRFTVGGLRDAVASLRDHQPLHDRTRAAHAAGFFVPGRGLVAVREDVGRHNALDKLAGALLRAGEDPARGAVVLTSRVSVEMVQKGAALGAAAIVAVSAPTSLAVRTARAAGLTLVGNVRGGAHEVFTRPERLTAEPPFPPRSASFTPTTVDATPLPIAASGSAPHARPIVSDGRSPARSDPATTPPTTLDARAFPAGTPSHPPSTPASTSVTPAGASTPAPRTVTHAPRTPPILSAGPTRPTVRSTHRPEFSA